MYEHHLVRVDIPQQVYYPFGVCVRRKGHIFNAHFNLIGLLIDIDSLLTFEEFVAEGAFYAVAGDDEGIPLVAAPLLEDLYAGACMQHTRSGEEHIRSICPDQTFVKGLHFLELKDIVACCELLLYLFVLPIREEAVVEVGFIDEAC